MTPARQPSTVRAPRDTPPPAFPLHVAGAALLPAALEACRQHERVAPLIEKGCAEAELREAAAVCELSDHHLAARTKDYEAVAAVGKGTTPDDFWRAANTLWHSSREYARRHRSCDALLTKLRKQPNPPPPLAVALAPRHARDIVAPDLQRREPRREFDRAEPPATRVNHIPPGRRGDGDRGHRPRGAESFPDVVSPRPEVAGAVAEQQAVDRKTFGIHRVLQHLFFARLKRWGSGMA